MDKDQEEFWDALKKRYLTLEEKLEMITAINNRLSQEQFNEMLAKLTKIAKKKKK